MVNTTENSIHIARMKYTHFRLVCLFIYLYVYNRPVLSSSTRNEGAIIYTLLLVLKAFIFLFTNTFKSLVILTVFVFTDVTQKYTITHNTTAFAILGTKQII